MALGGGAFIAQNKILPGVYVNFVSLARSGAMLSERGAAAFPLELDWGVEDNVFSVTNEDFVRNSLSIFGYDYADDKLKGIRELFRNIRTLYAYRLGSGGEKASCELGVAKYAGERGNDLTVVINEVSDTSSDSSASDFRVRTFIGGTLVDSQTVSSAASLRDNDFVVWNREVVLVETAGIPFADGSNGDVSVSSYQRFLDKIEGEGVNAIGVCSEDPRINSMFVSYVKNLRDNVGVKTQCVVFNGSGDNLAPDHEGVIVVKNAVMDDDVPKSALVYWVTGLIAGAQINRSNLNRVYDGEFSVFADFTGRQLEDTIRDGLFTLHRVGGTLRVLADINSLTTVSDTKGEVFKDNQTIRVIDQIASDIARLFNDRYLGTVPNDEAGRVSLWADIVKHHEDLERIRAIENFSDEDVEVLPGDDKRSVVVNNKVTIVNAMAQVYMTCFIA
ncbi:MAG: phage tail sheath subtilisin-like domain-containing protein [Oscillospiraceae bacterium]|nr:phage tail sheath subtilisin-like domain-containing protein [Oscillospiraceae bacterium]